MNECVGAVVRHHRERCRFSRAYLAGLVMISPGHLAKIEAGKSSPTIAVLKAISCRVGVPLCWMIQQIKDTETRVILLARGSSLDWSPEALSACVKHVEQCGGPL